MKKTVLISLFGLMITLGIVSCLPPKKEKITTADTLINTHDSVMAVQLGADNYGMKNYVLAFLKKGLKRWKMDSTTVATLQKGHLDNIRKMADEGKLVLAGPFADEGEMKGIYIFDVKTVDEAQKLCENDPAIVAGSLSVEFHPWYGSAALLKVNEIHKKIAKQNP